MRGSILIAMLLFMGFYAGAQSNSSSTERIKQAIKALLPEGEVIADVLADSHSTAGAGIVAAGKLSISIASDGKRFWFYTYNASQPAYSILDRVSINLERNTVAIADVELVYVGEADAVDHEDGFNWQGYRWHSEQSADPHKRSYRFAIGKLQDTGQTFMHIRVSEMTNGERKPQLNLPFLF